ncbi:glutamyl aminopeptidase-like [Physella acuta]|uniref:glutamyl aminopeptidase-like n=1 Tax=Physella acuta TaxID=109671 RepID=UPI0027DB61C5|nr:glutamyl aminopeptidase-like [Physella acuta]XP_059141544.1 glutamyl aminopeptidase-like [Physella acuta]
MEGDTFPDVTLADAAAMEHRAQTAPLRNENNDLIKDTFVVLRPKHKRFHVTRNQVILTFLVVLLVLIVAILVTAFVTRSQCDVTCGDCQGSQSGSLISGLPDPGSSNTGTSANSLNNFHKSTAHGNKSYPWTGIRLPRDLIPKQYEIRIKIDLTNFTYEGAVNITVNVNTSTKYVIFHRSLIDINESLIRIASNCTPEVKVVHQFQVPDKNFHVLELDRELDTGRNYTVVISQYTGNLTSNLRGLYLSSYFTRTHEKRYLSASQLQATDARKAFPCMDEPDMKAVFKLTIVYQTNYTALTNMPAKVTTRLNSDWLMTEFDETPVMSTYLIAVVVSDFKYRNFTFDNDVRYELKIWAREEAYSQTEHALNFSVETYKFFTDYFGMQDVVRKADHIAVPDFSSGAMENWGLVVYRETSLLYDRHVSSSHNKFTVTLIVAHEIAHTWFGNMVTMKWWDDLWLNEGFASLLMYLAMDHVYPQWNVFAIQVVVEIFPVMVKDALTTSHPVSSPIADPEDIPQHFDTISYSKGMAVLRMVMDFAGAENFRKGVSNYVQKYKFKNAEMSQLWDTFSESFNYTFDIAKIMDTWTRQMGYPVVTVVDNGDHFLLTQKRFLLDQTLVNGDDQESPFGYKWYIPFTYVTQEAPYDKKTIWLNLGSATIPKTGKGWLLGNYEFVGFYRVMYDKTMWGMFADQLMRNHTVFPEANRAGLIGDAFTFARANVLDYDVALNLTRYLEKEQSYIPWEAFHHSIEFLRGMLAESDAYVQLQMYLRKLVGPVFEVVGASDRGELPERYLRRVILSMACDVGVENAVIYAKTMFDNWMKHDTPLPPDLSMLICSVGIREGGAAEWDFVWQRIKSTEVAAEGDMMMESLVYTQKSWLLWRYINWVFDSEKIRSQDVRVVISYFSKTPWARMVAVNFAMSRWDDLVREFGQDQFLLREVIPEVTNYINTEFNLKQFEAVFKANTPRGASKSVDNALALIRANIGWMRANYNNIKQWLNTHNP